MGAIGITLLEGLQQTKLARDNAGWYIYPTKFGVSATLGTFVNTRGMADRNPEWYVGALTGGIPVNDTTLQLVGTIPVNQNGGVPIAVKELYYYCEGKSFDVTFDHTTNQITIPSDLYNLSIFVNKKEITLRTQNSSVLPAIFVEGQTYWIRKISANIIKLYPSKTDADNNTNEINFTDNGTGTSTIQMEFLAFLAQVLTDPDYIYDPSLGVQNLNPMFQLASIGDPNLFQFSYTQAYEISQHNLDNAAHPVIQTALNRHGIFVQSGDHEYVGQSVDEEPLGFDSGADAENTLVYLKADGLYGKALADGSIKERNLIGIVKGGIVRSLQGFVNIGLHGFTVGSFVYLSSTMAGAITSSGSTTTVGVVKSSTTVYLDKPLTVDMVTVGVSNFPDLGDVPDYGTSPNYFVRVNSSSNGIELVSPNDPSIGNAIGDATETQKGTLQVATTAEAQGLSVNDKILTPARLNEITSTETRRGVAEVATTAEVAAGTDDNTIVTPLKLAQALSGIGGGNSLELLLLVISDLQDQIDNLNSRLENLE